MPVPESLFNKVTGLYHATLLKEKTTIQVISDELCDILKGCVRYIFASLFLCLKESTCEARKNVFYFTSKALFVFEIIKF